MILNALFLIIWRIIILNNLLKQHGILLWPKRKIQDFRQTLLHWYDLNKRDLPWRQTRDPYAIWVSEIMLQQTQVATVIPYFLTFMQRFPTITALANAPEPLLLKTWEGLGYYSRVKNMQIAAQQMVRDYDSQMPQTIEDIKTLKGIGPYTAGAIASIAFDLPEPAVDGNVMRVMARLFEIDLDIGNPKYRKVFEYLVRQLIDPERPGDFNQALMDLGSDICSAKNPRPEDSPIKAFNSAYQNGTMHIYPIKSAKKKPVDVYYTAYVISNNKGEFLLQQRKQVGLLENMWLFPLVETTDSNTLKETVSSDYSVTIGHITHVFSHLKWHIEVVKIPQEHHKKFDGLFIHPTDFQHYPMPTPQQKMLKLLQQKNG